MGVILRMEKAKTMKRRKPTYKELQKALEAAASLVKERADYVSPNPESERPSFRTLRGCCGDALYVWLDLVVRSA